MIHQDLQATSDQQDEEQEVDVVGDANPCREAERSRGRFGCQRGPECQMRKTGRAPLDISSGNQEQSGSQEQQKNLRPNAHRHCTGTRPTKPTVSTGPWTRGPVKPRVFMVDMGCLPKHSFTERRSCQMAKSARSGSVN